MKTTVIFVALIAIIGVVYARPEDAKPQAPTSCINPPQPNQNTSEKPVQAPSEPPIQQTAQKSGQKEEKYTTKYDNIDLQEILKTERLLNGYFNCLMDKGSCTPDGEELKSILPDALHSGCTKCSEKQREGARTVMHYLIDNKRDLWNELEAKYDKNGEYRRRYKAEIEKEGLKL